MSDEYTKQDHANNIFKNLFDTPTRGVGQTLGDIWFLVFGGIAQSAEKKRLRYASDLEKFKETLSEKILNVPPEKRSYLRMQIVGTAFEDSKYCLEHEKLRELFANYITSSLNKDTENIVHPSFSYIIKQLSPLDATNLSYFYKQATHPCVDIVAMNDSGSHVGLIQDIFLGDTPIYSADARKQSFSVACLQQVGLIRKIEAILDGVNYEAFAQMPAFHEIDESCKSQNGGNWSARIFPRTLEITALGTAFVRACYTEAEVPPSSFQANVTL